MKTINVDLSTGEALNLPIGRQGENAVTQVVFDFSGLKTEFGTGTVSLSVKRPKEPTSYAQTITTSGTNATWMVNETDTGVAGCGEIQLTYTVNSQIAKTVVYKYTVYPSIGVDGEYPIPGQTWQQEIEEDIADIKEDLSQLEGGGLSDDAKAALLACFQNVAWSGADGDDYYQDLYDALYPPAPPATLTSITCVYTQSGAVYTTDSLDSLKSGLVVTAHYDNGTTQTVTAYTLSGTLTVGTSTITVSYGGKTTTFNVTVSDAPASALYDWNLKDSLTDTVNAVVATVSSYNAAWTQGTGVGFTNINGYIDYGEVYARDRTYELDVSSFGTAASGNPHRRLLAFATSNNTGSGGAALLYRANAGWRFYTGTAWDNTELTGTDGQTLFDGKTVKLYLDEDGYAHVSYKTIGADDSTYTLLGTSTSPMKDFTSGGHVYNGGSNNDSLASATISGFRIYEGEK